MNFIFDPSLVLYLPLYKLDGASFASRDAYGHVCIVTGALWRPNGHYFDGTDDKIYTGKNLYQSTATIEVWFKLDDTTQADRAIAGQLSTAGFWRVYGEGFGFDNGTLFLMSEANNDKSELTTSLADTNWHHAVGIVRTASGELYLDTSLKDSGDLNSGYNYQFSVGAAVADNPANAARFFNGSVGEVRVYNRALSAPEIQHNYLATKWRYR